MNHDVARDATRTILPFSDRQSTTFMVIVRSWKRAKLTSSIGHVSHHVPCGPGINIIGVKWAIAKTIATELDVERWSLPVTQEAE
jgi:hypothetical protein